MQLGYSGYIQGRIQLGGGRLGPPGHKILVFSTIYGRKIFDQFISVPPPGKILYPPLEIFEGLCIGGGGGYSPV